MFSVFSENKDLAIISPKLVRSCGGVKVLITNRIMGGGGKNLSTLLANKAIMLDTSRILYFDEIAFMLGKWENVKNKPLASAISVSNLDGQIIKSPIIIGGDDILTKSQPTSLCDLQLPTVLKKTGIASIDETLAAYFEDPLTNTDLHTPTSQASKDASDNGMDHFGVNKSAYFKTTR